MGMDVIGMNPQNEAGEFLRLNISTWRPLAALCCTVAPVETEPCKSWQFNDGDGLDAKQSELLAQKLKEVLADGSIDECLGGLKSDSDDQCLDDLVSMGDICVVCLKSHPDYRWVKSYVPIFIQFLRACGGFRIC